VSARRDLTGLVTQGQAPPPERTVASPPPRQRAAHDGRAALGERSPQPADRDGPGVTSNQSHKPRAGKGRTAERAEASPPAARRKAGTVRISVNIPLACRQWLAAQAGQQQRFVSEIVMDALDRHGDDAHPPTGRTKRRAVPDGTICNIVLPAEDRARIDQAVAAKQTTRSALLSDVLDLARKE